jgi:hypothetical protein
MKQFSPEAPMLGGENNQAFLKQSYKTNPLNVMFIDQIPTSRCLPSGNLT